MENPAPLHPNPKVAEALSFLQAAEQSAASGTSTGVVWAVQQYDYALERLRAVEEAPADVRRLLAMALLGRGNSVLNRRQENALADAVKAFDEAVNVITSGDYPDENNRANDEANAWLAKAMALAGAGGDLAKQSLECFDRSLQARARVGDGKPEEIRHALAIGWISRSDAAIRSGDIGLREEAVRSLDQAIALLKELPYLENDYVRHQLAMAYMNRGIAVQAGLASQESLREALRNYGETLTLIEGQRVLERPEGKHLYACTLLNQGGANSRLLGAEPAIEMNKAAKAALAVVAETAEQQVPLSEVSLRARLLIAKTSLDLSEGKDGADVIEQITEATDSIDEGLSLIRTWEKRQVHAFRPFAVDLFCLGAVLYQRYQPQFLAEYALEILDPERSADALGGNQDMFRVALDCIGKAVQAHQHYSFSGIGDPALEKKLETLKELREADARLRFLIAPKPKAPDQN